MERKVSISIGFIQRKFGDAEALKIAKEIGADAVDFSTEHFDCNSETSLFAKSDDEICEYFTNLKKTADSLGLEIGQTHGRTRSFINDDEWNMKNVGNMRLDFLAASCLGAPYCVIHNVTTGAMGADCEPQVIRDKSLEMFKTVIPFAKKYGVKFATETFGDSPVHGCCDFFGQSDEFIMNYNRVCAQDDNADWLVTCVDTGHCNKAMRFGQPKPADVIRLLGPSIKCLHLNDNDTLTDQHKPPLSGTIDWFDVLSALDEVGYCGNYNMELALSWFGKDICVETAAYSIKVMRNLLDVYYSGRSLK